MNEVLRPGRVGKLIIAQIEKNEAFLEHRSELVSINVGDLPLNAKAGDEIEVFMMYGDDDEISVSSQIPEITEGVPGTFQILNVSNAGAYINIGATRDILIPNQETREELKPGQYIVVTLVHDRENKRLILSTRLEYHLRGNSREFEHGEKVKIHVYRQISAAYRVVIEDKYLGILFEKDCLFRPRVGDKLVGYVRKTEGREVVISLQKEGAELLEDAKSRIMNALENSRGYIRLTDDSSSADIKLRLRISKKTFKKAAGMLYKDGKIELGKRGIKLVKK